MRTENSIKNGLIAAIMTIINIVIGFIAQKIFIITLGTEYLGLNSLFNNIISMLTIVEFGFGSAIIYNLYKPLANNNKEEVKSLLRYYKKVYRIIAVIISIIGILFLPFLKFIINNITINENLFFIFILYILDTVASYLLTYKRSILYADQKTYIINIVHIIYLIILNTIQIIILFSSKNFVLYLLVKILCRIAENVLITVISNKKYPYIKDKHVENLNKEIKNNIIEKIKGLFFHRIGSFIVLGTDNIIISKFLGIVNVGLYSNYNLIIVAVSNLFGQVFSSITATIGNLLVEENKEKTYITFKRIMILGIIVFTFASASILCLIEPFINLWLGKEYILPYSALIILVINFYLQGIRKVYGLFKEAAGIFYEDRYVPLIESIVNIVVSIVLVKKFGLSGVFLGTVASCMVLYVYSFPKFVYKGIFKRSIIEYIKENLEYMIPSSIAILITAIITKNINFNNDIIQLIVNGIICLIIPNLIMFLIFFKTDEFKYYINLVKNIFYKLERKKYKTE